MSFTFTPIEYEFDIIRLPIGDKVEIRWPIFDIEADMKKYRLIQELKKKVNLLANSLPKIIQTGVNIWVFVDSSIQDYDDHHGYYYYRVMKYYLSIPVDIYNTIRDDKENYDRLLSATKLKLQDNRYIITHIHIIHEKISPDQELVIKQAKDNPKNSEWEDIPTVPGKEGIIYL